MTAFHAVKSARERLEKAGFKQIKVSVVVHDIAMVFIRRGKL
jgi:hypothetical protein